MTEEPHLILHKVRNAPAYDIAIKAPCTMCQDCENTFNELIPSRYPQEGCSMCDGEGFSWIIPTSGHRAYPYRIWPLLEMYFDANIIDGGGKYKLKELDNSTICPPSNWPDHYSINDRKAKLEPNLIDRLVNAARVVTGTRRV